MSERLSGVISKIGNMGKGAGLGEMIMSLVFLVNACFLMCMSLNGM